MNAPDTQLRKTTIVTAESKERYGEHYATGYDERRFTTTEGAFAQRFEEELFARMLHAHGVRTVLDAPVGTGRMAIPLAGQFTITGADISPAMLSSARARAKTDGVDNLTWVECSVDRLPFPDGQFDAVLTARLFQHVPKQMAHAIVCELSRVVKPDGVLVVQFRSGLFGVVLKFLRYYVIRKTGNIRHKCIFPDQVQEYFKGHEIVARFGYKFPVSGRAARVLGYGTVAAIERALANTPGIRWFGKYMTFVVRRRPAGSVAH
ncbi:MAG: class I SAM-dependent methyltransferase [Acidobacteria bacterium]|nr:class I SAM-dependent methyltransferase [Acidobacteriota bacterium]